MERRFKVEAKTFFFSTKASQLRLEERRKGFLGLILVDLRGAAWLAETVDEASRFPALADFDKSSSEGRKSLSVKGGCNKGGRFLEVVAFVDDDRKGIIWIPEARSGRGWRRFVTELRSWLAALTSSPGFSSEDSSTEDKVDERSPGLKSGRSYAEVLRSPPCVVEVGPQLRSTQELDLFPVASSFEVGDGGGEASSAWVCYELETAIPPLKADVLRPESKLKFLGISSTADSVGKGKKMMEGILVIRWLMKLLGYSKGDLDWVLDGLPLKPNGSVGWDLSLGPGLESVSGPCESEFGLDSGPDLGSVVGPSGLIFRTISAHGPGKIFSPGSGVGSVSAVDDGLSASGDGSTSAAGVGVWSAAGDGSFSGAGKSSGPVDEDSSPGSESAFSEGSADEGSAAPATPSSVASELSRWVSLAPVASGSEFLPQASPPFPAAGDRAGSAIDEGSGSGSELVSGEGSVDDGSGFGSESASGEGSIDDRSGSGSESASSEGSTSPGLSNTTHPVASEVVSASCSDFGLAKSQIWLLGWIKERLKSNEKVKDKDHLALLKEMEKDFLWINLVAREQGRLVVNEKDIRAISVVACEGGQWEVDEEEDDRKLAWLIEIEKKKELSMMVKWPGSGKMISL
jgi:hypothetical protein